MKRKVGHAIHDILETIDRFQWKTRGKRNAVIVEALADPTVRERIANIGFEIPPREQLTPAALGAFHRTEIAKWWPIMKAANIKVE